MAQFIEFVGNHWILSTLWVALVTALILHRSKTSGESVSAQQAVMLINRSDAVVVDIRDKKDFDAGHIVEAIHIPLAKLGTRVTELEKHKSVPVIVACRLGQHSADAIKVLRSAGFTNVLRLSGGMTEWRAQSLPLVQK
ncbi:MAG: rhodanese-like domain-containing protein [Gammaproteobacteria bacterium]|nr:rhodanese-like domain-containing protein [Gammaproteobacteria bacterium]MDP2139940.1 rhodanese-like domain-containing protein [Gammaproteobacteria bacterium]MDP2347760.1 rhodanese-like domain-containing protein [Gammaproteobacteria bacterium]